jgi:hypothetical protein
MIEADAPSMGELYLCVVWCGRPTGGRHGLTTDDPAQRFKGAKRRAAPGTKETQRRPGQYSGWGPTPSFAAAKLGSLILRESCYNVVTRAPTVGNDSLLYPTASERRECMLAMLFWVLAALAVVGALAIDWALYLLVRRWL